MIHLARCTWHNACDILIFSNLKKEMKWYFCACIYLVTGWIVAFRKLLGVLRYLLESASMLMETDEYYGCITNRRTVKMESSLNSQLWSVSDRSSNIFGPLANTNSSTSGMQADVSEASFSWIAFSTCSRVISPVAFGITHLVPSRKLHKRWNFRLLYAMHVVKFSAINKLEISNL